MPSSRRDQPATIRFTHWLNVPLLVVMAGSGLQIWMAYPFLGPRGALYRWFPFQGLQVPAALRVGGWLAGARAVHFGCMWLLAANALVYLGYVIASGEWRRRAFEPRRDARSAVRTAGAYLRLRQPGASSGLYNGLQRLAYTAAIGLGALAVGSGLAIWKPVQLGALTRSFGGYDAARAVHLASLVALTLFALGHVLMVALHPRALLSMLSGGARRERQQNPE